MDVQTLTKQLKTATPAPIYLILGTELVQMDAVRQAFLTLIPEAERVMNVGSYDLEVTPLATALDDAMAAPFFGERRLVMLNKPAFLTGNAPRGGLKQDPAALRDYLKHPQPSSVVVLFAPYEKLDGRKGVVKDLKQVAVTVSTAPLTEPQARQQVTAKLRADGYQLAAGALDELVARTNANYGKMAAALPELELYAYQAKRITLAAVQGLVPQAADENVFDLVEAVLANQQVVALKRYRELLASQHQPLQLNAILVSQFRLLLQLKILAQHGFSQGTLANKLKVHPYRVKLGLQAARKFKMEDLSRAYLGLIRCERALKTSSQSPELLFQLFMLQYSKQQAS